MQGDITQEYEPPQQGLAEPTTPLCSSSPIERARLFSAPGSPATHAATVCHQAMVRALGWMSHEDRVLLSLRYTERLSDDAISALLGGEMGARAVGVEIEAVMERLRAAWATALHSAWGGGR